MDRLEKKIRRILRWGAKGLIKEALPIDAMTGKLLDLIPDDVCPECEGTGQSGVKVAGAHTDCRACKGTGRKKTEDELQKLRQKKAWQEFKSIHLQQMLYSQLKDICKLSKKGVSEDGKVSDNMWWGIEWEYLI